MSSETAPAASLQFLTHGDELDLDVQRRGEVASAHY
jgi:hypothetical protein